MHSPATLSHTHPTGFLLMSLRSHCLKRVLSFTRSESSVVALSWQVVISHIFLRAEAHFSHISVTHGFQDLVRFPIPLLWVRMLGRAPILGGESWGTIKDSSGWLQLCGDICGNQTHNRETLGQAFTVNARPFHSDSLIWLSIDVTARNMWSLLVILCLIDIQPYGAKSVLSSYLMDRHYWNRRDRLTEFPQVLF